MSFQLQPKRHGWRSARSSPGPERCRHRTAENRCLRSSGEGGRDSPALLRLALPLRPSEDEPGPALSSGRAAGSARNTPPTRPSSLGTSWASEEDTRTRPAHGPLAPGTLRDEVATSHGGV